MLAEPIRLLDSQLRYAWIANPLMFRKRVIGRLCMPDEQETSLERWHLSGDFTLARAFASNIRGMGRP